MDNEPRYPTRVRTQSAIANTALKHLIATGLHMDLHACSVLHPNTGTPMLYKDLIKFGGTCKVWSAGMCKELGHLSQGYKDTTGIDTIFFLVHEEITTFPKDRIFTYAQIVVDYCPQNSIQIK